MRVTHHDGRIAGTKRLAQAIEMLTARWKHVYHLGGVAFVREPGEQAPMS
jgi:hypothetical protein